MKTTDAQWLDDTVKEHLSNLKDRLQERGFELKGGSASSGEESHQIWLSIKRAQDIDQQKVSPDFQER